MRSRGPKAREKAEPRNYCERCRENNGWRFDVVVEDPMYSWRNRARPCECDGASLLREKVADYARMAKRTPGWQDSEDAAAERIRAMKAARLEANPNASDLEKPNARSTMYVPPSERPKAYARPILGYGESVAAYKELSQLLEPHVSGADKNVAYWDRLREAYPDPVGALRELS